MISAAVNFPATTCQARTGAVNSVSKVPSRRSSAKLRIVSSGNMKK
jgi:hypothetical protein